MGPNCVTTFSSQIISAFNKAIASYMSLILNLVQFICNILAIIFLAKRFGRRPILLVGVGLMTIFSYGIAISLLE
jgi:MFS family permease